MQKHALPVLLCSPAVTKPNKTARENNLARQAMITVDASACEIVKPAAVPKNTVKPAAIEIDVRVYYNDYGNHRNNTEETRF